MVAQRKGRRRFAAALIISGFFAACGEAPEQTQTERQAPPATPEEPDLATKQSWDGAEVYDEVCDKCHKMGVDGAPELGDTEAWGPRLAKDEEVLFRHVKEGFNKMPPRGECEFCTDEQLRAALDYMIANSR